jgi:hypothetical protein
LWLQWVHIQPRTQVTMATIQIGFVQRGLTYHICGFMFNFMGFEPSVCLLILSIFLQSPKTLPNMHLHVVPTKIVCTPQGSCSSNGLERNLYRDDWTTSRNIRTSSFHYLRESRLAQNTWDKTNMGQGRSTKRRG